MTLKSLLLGAALAAAAAGGANALTIKSYTQTGVPASGFGGWSYNYNAGAGTLNDGVVPTSLANDELLDLGGSPSITFQLDGTYKLSEIDILSNYVLNYIPGNLTSATVTIGSTSANVSSSGFGPTGASGFPLNERLTLPTDLASLSTNSFTLSNFNAQGPYSQYASLGEVTANGVAVPEPATWALMLVGLGGLGASLRLRRRAVLAV